jgi:hypothetical protein
MSESADATQAEWLRRKRIAEVFGDVLPESTSDDRDEPSARARSTSSDQWLREQVPPHHGTP